MNDMISVSMRCCGCGCRAVVAVVRSVEFETIAQDYYIHMAVQNAGWTYAPNKPCCPHCSALRRFGRASDLEPILEFAHAYVNAMLAIYELRKQQSRPKPMYNLIAVPGLREVIAIPNFGQHTNEDSDYGPQNFYTP